MENTGVSVAEQGAGPVPWQSMARCERLIGRLDEILKRDTLFDTWIAVESRIEALRQMALLGELIHADHLCDYEIGLRAFARMDTRSFPEALGSRRAVMSISRQTYPLAPGARRLQDLFYRALAPSRNLNRDLHRVHAAGRKKSMAMPLSELVLEDVYGDGQGWQRFAEAEVLQTVFPEQEGMPPRAGRPPLAERLPLAVFEEIAEAWDTLPAEDGLLSVARGVRGVFRMADRFPSRDGERGFTHLAMLAVPMLIRRFCQTRRPIGFISSVVARRSEGFRSALYASDDAWFTTFLDLLADGLEGNLRRVNALGLMGDQMQPVIDAKRKSSVLPQLVALLFGQPVLTVGEVSRRLGVSVRAANQVLQELKQEKFISARGGRERYRVWEAFRVLDMMERA